MRTAAPIWRSPFGSDNVSVFLGDGRGLFGEAANFRVGQSPRAVAAGDFNGDRRADLVVVNHLSDDLSLLAGDGRGGFMTAVPLAVGSGPVAVLLADFDRDGRADLATANAKPALSLSSRATVGAVYTRARPRRRPRAFLRRRRRLDADGRTDLAAANSGSHTISSSRVTGAVASRRRLTMRRDRFHRRRRG